MAETTQTKIGAWLDSDCTGHYCDGSWRDWFIDILDALLTEGEGFGGKRPGNNDSDWEAILAHSLIDAGILPGERTWIPACDEHDYSFSWADYRAIMPQIVRTLIP